MNQAQKPLILAQQCECGKPLRLEDGTRQTCTCGRTWLACYQTSNSTGGDAAPWWWVKVEEDVPMRDHGRGMTMRANDYAEAAMGYLNPDVAENEGNALLINAALGLAGEAGEFCDLVKKHLHQGHPLDPAALAKEAGDIAWYLAAACKALGISLEDVLAINLTKLGERYPGGRFTTERSLHRVGGTKT